MNKLTIRTLAKELGLSVSTISKAIRDSHEISEVTKQRVNDLVTKLNYVPNPYASSLRQRSSKTIGVVIPEVVDSFFAQAINGIESVAQEKGFHVLIYLTHESFEKEKMILKDFESGRVDGVLMSVSRETTHGEHIKGLMDKGVPLIFFDRVFDAIQATRIITNDYESAYLATRHLLQTGCRQLLFLSFSTNLTISGNRLAGYRHALEEGGIKVLARNILALNNDPKKDFLSLQKKLASVNRADGILASVEKFGITVYQVCEALRLRIPEDIQVISFSNLETASFLHPPLTTVAQPAFEMGRNAAELLVKSLRRKKYDLQREEIIIPSTLVVRKSTKHPAT